MLLLGSCYCQNRLQESDPLHVFSPFVELCLEKSSNVHSLWTAGVATHSQLCLPSHLLGSHQTPKGLSLIGLWAISLNRKSHCSELFSAPCSVPFSLLLHSNVLQIVLSYGFVACPPSRMPCFPNSISTKDTHLLL